jgi:hypothetical protein
MPSVAEFLGNYDNPCAFGSRVRRQRVALFVDQMERIASATGRCRVLDIGGTETYWNIVDRARLRRMGCRIILLNLRQEMVRDESLFEYRVGDATAIDMPDNAFDLVHSNSVIEHVGNWRHMLMFSREVRRLAPRYFVQTPNYWFPWEPHFGTPLFQYVPHPLQAALLMRRQCGFFARCSTLSAAIEAIESVHLADKKMMRCLFPDARILHERFCGLTKSFIAIRD